MRRASVDGFVPDALFEVFQVGIQRSKSRFELITRNLKSATAERQFVIIED